MPLLRSVVELSGEEQEVLSRAASGKTAQEVIVEAAAGIKQGAEEAKRVLRVKEISADDTTALRHALAAREQSLRALPAGDARDAHLGEVLAGIALCDEMLGLLN